MSRLGHSDSSVGHTEQGRGGAAWQTEVQLSLENHGERLVGPRKEGGARAKETGKSTHPLPLGPYPL